MAIASRTFRFSWSTGAVALIGALGALLAGLLVGRERQLLAVVVVGALFIGLCLLTVPNAAVTVGGALVFAGGFAFAVTPLPEIGAALMITGILIGKREKWQPPVSLLLMVPLLLSWLVFVAFDDFGDPLVLKRFTNLVLWLALVVATAFAGSAQRDICRGLLWGLMISVPASLFFQVEGYGSRWVGLMGDPNAFALVVAVAVPLIVDGLRLAQPWNWVVWLVGAGLVVLADSRTGILAVATALVVYLLLPWLRAWAMGIPMIAIWLTSNLPDDVVRGGRWEDRVGSDELRERIDAASTRQIQENLWTGRTLGEGKVDLSVYGQPPQDLVFYLHNSYKSLITESGLVGVGLYAALVFGALIQGLRGTVARGPLAAIAAAAVMATQLGEVLYSVPVALAIGMAWGSPTDRHDLAEPMLVSANAGASDQPVKATGTS